MAIVLDLYGCVWSGICIVYYCILFVLYIFENEKFSLHFVPVRNSTFLAPIIQGVTGGTDQTSGECSLGQTIPI